MTSKRAYKPKIDIVKNTAEGIMFNLKEDKICYKGKYYESVKHK